MKEFKEFLLKTNALALAVGVIIGGAVGKVVVARQRHPDAADRAPAREHRFQRPLPQSLGHPLRHARRGQEGRGRRP